jgi:secreted trypsin-like serine protease
MRPHPCTTVPPVVSRHPLAALAASLAALALAACTGPPGVSRSRAGILLGQPAPEGAYPETVALVFPADGFFFCSGSLISPRVVLTAAHCVLSDTGQPSPPSEIGIYLGNVAIEVPSGEIHAVSAVYAHPDFSWNAFRDANDIAVLKLSQDVTSVTPTPIVPVAEATQLTAGTDLLIVGFGMTSNQEQPTDGTKYFASTPLEEMGTKDFIAGTTGEPDTCYGDSGGPAFVANGGTRRVLGITSMGVNPNTDQCGDGTLFTLASAYVGWIESKVGPLGPNPVPTDGGVADGSAAHSDSGPALPDAGPVTPEAGVTSPEAGPTAHDAGSLAADGGPQGGHDGAGAGSQGDAGSGCGCAVPGAAPGLGGLGWLLAALALFPRRRARGASAAPPPRR